MSRRVSKLWPALLFASVASIALAQSTPAPAPAPRLAPADAAGVRALHLCSGYFNTEAPRALIDATAETNRNPIAPVTARTEVDEQAKTVSVYYSDAMPPRIAVSRGALGCTMAPIGASKAQARALPTLALTPPKLDDRPWPMGDRDALRPLAADKDAAVRRVIDEAFRDGPGAYAGDTWGVVVVKDGRIVAERYQEGFGPHIAVRTNSMCKSISTSMVGIGVRRGLIDINRKPALRDWATPGDPRGEITLDQIMRMTSGLYVEAPRDPTLEVYRSGAAVSEVGSLNMVEYRPGTRFVYSGADTNLTARAVRLAVNNDATFRAFPYRELLWKIGMTRTTLEMDWKGDFITSGQCWSTARDFGRFGMLYLADGVWNGERILPRGWNTYVSTRGPVQPIKPSIGGDADFGAQFWLYGGMEGLPQGVYASFGAAGQYMVVIPSHNLVIVRRGFDRESDFRIQKFAADVMNAAG